MLVTDLRHLLDLAADAPAPARRLARRLGVIVRAATAGDAGIAWETALPCPRRPAHQRCPGRIVVLVRTPDAPVHWRWRSCGDEGTISNWVDSPCDLRRLRLTAVDPAPDVALASETAAVLRELRLLDSDGERLVYRIRGRDDHAILAATDDDLEDLAGAVAAEANSEPDRRRRQRLDAAFEALTAAASTRCGR